MRLPRLDVAMERLRSLPPRQAVVAATQGGKRWAEQTATEAHRRLTPTFGQDPGAALARLLPAPNALLLAPLSESLSECARNYLDHRFDLLGSGWVQVKHGVRAAGRGGHRYPPEPRVVADPEGRWLAGRLNRANLARSRQIWSLVDHGYQPIDWHLDFISGFRWSESTWYTAVAYGQTLGVDVKVPWELARAQHLPQLAMAYAAISSSSGACSRPGQDQPSSPVSTNDATADRAHPGHELVREFRNQVLDFAATNPPSWGVNWRCTMDVGIRVANWLVAYDLFRAQGAMFDFAFESCLRTAVADHARFIVANLEWGPGLRSNHYLADIVGLLFAAAYLAPSAVSDTWLAFAIAELLVEVEIQFDSQGANFEGSTCYHRLSAEMVAYASALVLSLPQARLDRLGRVDPASLKAPPPFPCPPTFDRRGCPFPQAYVDRLAGMAEFTMAATKPSGRVAQIGDNDSGRFLRLLPIPRLPESSADTSTREAPVPPRDASADRHPGWREEHLDHRHLVGAIAGLLARSDDASPRTSRMLDWSGQVGAIEAGLTAGMRVRDLPFAPTPPSPGIWVSGPGDGSNASAKISPQALFSAGTHQQVRWLLVAAEGSPLNAGLEHRAFPGFGLFVFSSIRLFLAIRCGPVGQLGNGGHAHNDQLGIELTIDGVDWFADPGTYVYTPLPSERNRYRSVMAHFAPRVGHLEPGPLDQGLFTSPERTHARAMDFGEGRFSGTHRGFGTAVIREILIADDHIQVVDTIPIIEESCVFAEDPVCAEKRVPGDRLGIEGDLESMRNRAASEPGLQRRITGPSDLARWLGNPLPFSPGYGMIVEDAGIERR
ncbi:MAG: heparinase II/III domain-containing protein [Acidimicrobiales bacterium]